MILSPVYPLRHGGAPALKAPELLLVGSPAGLAVLLDVWLKAVNLDQTPHPIPFLVTTMLALTRDL